MFAAWTQNTREKMRGIFEDGMLLKGQRNWYVCGRGVQCVIERGKRV